MHGIPVVVAALGGLMYLAYPRDGWRPSRIAVTISGARKLSLRVRVK